MLLVINTADDAKDMRYIDQVLELIPKNLEVKVKHFSEVQAIPRECTRVIISGNSIFNDGPSPVDIPAYFSWLRITGRPVLGICAGQQIIAQFFGSKRKEKDARGNKIFDIIDSDIILEGVKTKFLGYVSHNFASRQPASFKVIARSGDEYLAKHRARSIYMSTFHPEFSEKRILTNFLNI